MTFQHIMPVLQWDSVAYDFLLVILSSTGYCMRVMFWSRTALLRLLAHLIEFSYLLLTRFGAVYSMPVVQCQKNCISFGFLKFQHTATDTDNVVDNICRSLSTNIISHLAVPGRCFKQLETSQTQNINP